jgi:hypothetical protein
VTQKRYPPSRCSIRSFAVLWVLIALPACGRTDAGKGGPRAEPPPAAADLDRCTQDSDCRLSPKLLRSEARSDEAFCCAGTCPVMRAYTAKRLADLEAEYRARCPRGHFGCPKTDCSPPPVGEARCVAGACQQVGGKGRGG